MKTARRLAAIVLVVAAVAFLAHHLYGAIRAGDLPDQVDWSLTAALAAAYGLVLALGGLNWGLLLGGLGHALPRLTAVSILLVSQIGKYLPGNVGHLVGRVGLAKAYGVPVALAVLAVSGEIALTLLTAVLVCAIGLLFAPDLVGLTGGVGQPGWIGFAILGASGLVLVGLMALPRLVPSLPAVLRRRLEGAVAISPRTAFTFIALQGGQFVVQGGIVGGLAVALGEPFPPLAQTTTLFAVAWVLGFLLPGAPGGLGVREALLVAGFAPLLGPGPAVALSLLLRLVTVLGDGMGFVIGSLLARRIRLRRECAGDQGA
ncbi:conserved hypothetical protein [Rhodospirillum rubrum ATCC 11170]|uniref:Flippase-like domain-containing protein n=1 Tax=Rhodospirillum rubrum (strain ATCC 11170 / ATH 1.1.1 / DSM 467 / LMG 4362 / NCIMB 8255 / S1) TaxID=269796 RepID=Q2RSH3_RHORT|nr:lysylphosphatidylglycerol synthase domain-containing protein [Rhodospirillum rubrum]ABC22922.1 conserved hypothetical protein [Rhodospirillum rubrum ATCC 11170]MBK5954539.1 hypothetical protein [Rhodospirillum rubrum]QXG78908.1 flippase-like domain-containing protein [Rhodospirillum rubrum]